MGILTLPRNLVLQENGRVATEVALYFLPP